MPSLPVHAVDYRAVSSIGRAASLPAARPILLLAIDTLQLSLGNRDRALGILRAGAVVGEHVDHQEVGDRRRRLLAGGANAGNRITRLLAWLNTWFFGSAVHIGDDS